MTLIIDALIIAALFGLFGYSHTFLASNKLKKNIAEKAGDKIAFYRLFYNAVSLISFLLIYGLSPKPGIVIYDLNYPWDIIIFVFQFFSLMGFVWAVSAIDVWEFLGIKQVIRRSKGIYNPGELDEVSELKVDGPFKYSRHPIYFFSILFLGLRPTMSFFYLIFYLCLTAYFIIGAVYEEKKLVEKFGERYEEYRRNVSMLIPYKIFKHGTS